ncbi:MAG: hypothetical protein LIP77_02585 [Planctomycetes bacterium]|nr:hypothetical protein [Planctomycetota bacterium]
MAESWHIARSSRTCAHSGQPIPPGVPFYSALVETDDSFQRVDYAAEAWPQVNPEDFFSYWKNKGTAASGEKKQPVDYERLLAFFDSLAGVEEPGKRLLRYVIALILVRRRHLRLDEMSKTATGGDRLLVYDKRTEAVQEVLAPEAGRAEVAATQEKLTQLFECDFEEPLA